MLGPEHISFYNEHGYVILHTTVSTTITQRLLDSLPEIRERHGVRYHAPDEDGYKGLVL
jgi:hypothetical protein